MFAARRHVEGEIAETCPVVLFSATFVGVSEEVRKRLFNGGALSGRVSDNHCDALGYGSTGNHDNPSKIAPRRRCRDERAPLRGDPVDRARRGAAVNESVEGCGRKSPEKDWFSRMRVTRYVDRT